MQIVNEHALVNIACTLIRLGKKAGRAVTGIGK
jgi:hypothetical protein